jgi:hypothetical protein
MEMAEVPDGALRVTSLLLALEGTNPTMASLGASPVFMVKAVAVNETSLIVFAFTTTWKVPVGPSADLIVTRALPTLLASTLVGDSWVGARMATISGSWEVRE